MTKNSSKQNNNALLSQQQLINTSYLSQSACSSKGINEMTTQYPIPEQYSGNVTDKIFSSDGWHSVFKVATTSSQTIYKNAAGSTIYSSGIIQTYIIDGVKQKDYASVDQFIFSPNNCHYAYVAQNTNSIKYFVVIDGKIGPEYDSVSSLIFSPDSSDIIYIADRGNKEFLVLNGHELPGYSRISNVTFSPNNKRIAYFAALKNSKKYIVSGGNVIRDSPGRLITIDYDTTKGNQRTFSIDNTIRNVSHGVVIIKFSHDSNHFAYSTVEQVVRTTNAQHFKVPAFTINQMCIYLDNAAIGCGDDDFSTWVFTHSGDLSYYLSSGVHQGGLLSIHNKETDITLTDYQTNSMSPQFTPDGENYYYVNDDFQHCQSAGSVSLIVNGHVVTDYAFIGSIMPSPDSKKLLVIAHYHNKDCSEGIGGYFIVDVKKLTEENTGISNRAEGVQFIPDGKFLTAVDDDSIIFNSNKYAIPSRNGLNNPNSLYYFNAAEAVNPIIISPNDQKFAYVIQQTIISEANPTTALYSVFVNINSEKFDSYDQIFMKPIFSKDSSKIMYPAQKGNNFYWIVNNTQ